MLHVGVGVYHRSPEARAVPALRCRMVLEGLATGRRRRADLDRSDARKTADAIIAAWPPRHESADDRESIVMSAAREEFGRRGYAATTVRDIAATAGVSTKAVYRIAPSKEDLLWRILGWYSQHVVDARDAVLDADSSPLEKLDATLWLNINTIDRFQAEMNILASFFQVLLRPAPISSSPPNPRTSSSRSPNSSTGSRSSSMRGSDQASSAWRTSPWRSWPDASSQ